MASRAVVSRVFLNRRLMESTRTISPSRYFSDGKGKIFSEEERAAETIYIKKMERERMEKLKTKAEKEKAAAEKDSKKEFDLNIPPHVARPLMEKKFPQFFRTKKHALHKNIIRTVASKREAITKCPNDMDKVWWEAFVENEFEEKKKKQDEC